MTTSQTSNNDTTISWKAPSHLHHKKDSWWWTKTATITVLILIIAVWLENYLFTLFITLTFIILWHHNITPPQIYTYTVTNEGVYENNLFYPYHSLRSFWIRREGDNEYVLVLEPEGGHVFVPIVFPITTNPQHLREFLLTHLPEERYEKGLLESIGEWLGL